MTTGFIDGTENPPIEDATDVAMLPAGVPGGGGSFVLAMRWSLCPVAYGNLT